MILLPGGSRKGWQVSLWDTPSPEGSLERRHGSLCDHFCDFYNKETVENNKSLAVCYTMSKDYSIVCIEGNEALTALDGKVG